VKATRYPLEPEKSRPSVERPVTAAAHLAGKLLLPSFLLLAGPSGHAAGAHAEADTAPGTYIWVDDHRLHLDCRGSGSPTVVFDSGLGGSSLDWALVQPGVAGFTRACTYDRAGYAWSDPGPLPRNAERMVSDLEQMLGNGSVAAPYVLVGHSLGGLIVQHFARKNPQRIAGLVLVDATHEDQFRRLDETVALAATTRWSHLEMYDSYDVPEGLPEDVTLLARAFVARPQSIVVVRSELRFLRESSGPAAPETGTLPDVPLVVISHRLLTSAESGRNDGFEETWMEMQQALAARIPGSRHVIAATHDHYIHIREPQTVVDAVQDIVQRHRRGLAAGAGASLAQR
jgi:pimeloyl-ACP methyl ester carboxylesterase